MDDPVAPLAESARFFVAALCSGFAPLIVRTENLGLRTWSDGKSSGTRIEIFLRLDGTGAGAIADAFCESPAAAFDIPGFEVREISVGTAVRACNGSWARIGLEAVICPAPRELVVVREQDEHPSGLVVPVRGRDGQPWFLLGYLSGNVAITNSQPQDWATRLYRFHDERQARAAGEIIVQHARLDVGGDCWFVPEIRQEFEPKDATAAMLRWIEAIDATIALSLRGLGHGHYSLANKVRERL